MRCALASIVLVLSVAAGYTRADIINGGFESGDFTGWTVTVSDGHPQDLSSATVLSGSAPEGSYYAYLKGACEYHYGFSGYARVQQVFQAGAGDTLSFDARASHQFVSDNQGAEASETYDVIGPSSYHVNNTIPEGSVWNGYSVSLGDAGQYTLTFQAYSNVGTGNNPASDSYMRVDNVRLSAVPEPSALLLAAVGLIGSLAFCLWRKRR